MNTISIGPDTRSLDEADAEWITQEINQRRKDGQIVCVRVQIRTDDLGISFSTPTCGGGGSGGRPPTPKERKLLDLWDTHGLNEQAYAPGAVVAFVKQVLRFL